MSEKPNPAAGHEEIIRWGDRKPILLPIGDFPVPGNIQLVKVHRHVPETWTIIVWAQIQSPAATWDATVQYTLIIGSGSAQIELAPSIRLQSAAAAEVQTFNSLVTKQSVGFLTFQLPAVDIQAGVIAAANNGAPDINLEVACLVAPRFSHPTHGEGGGRQLMPEGFNPEALRWNT